MTESHPIFDDTNATLAARQTGSHPPRDRVLGGVLSILLVGLGSLSCSSPPPDPIDSTPSSDVIGGPMRELSPDAPAEQQNQIFYAQLGLITLAAPRSHIGQLNELLPRSGELLSKLEADLRQPLEKPVTIALIPNPVPPKLQELDRAATPWAAGFMFPVERVGAVRLDRVTKYPFDSTEMVFVHELSHQLLHDKVGRAVPRWFDEAVATQEGRRRGTRDFLLFTTTTLTSQIPRLASLDRGFRGSEHDASRAYAVSFEFLTWISKQHGPDFAADVLDATARRLDQSPLPLDERTPFEAAWQEVAGVPLEISEQQWRQRAYRWTRFLPLLLTSNWLWVAMAMLAFVAFLSRRRQRLEQYRRWEEEELLEAKPVEPRISALGPLGTWSGEVDPTLSADDANPSTETELHSDSDRNEPVH